MPWKLCIDNNDGVDHLDPLKINKNMRDKLSKYACDYCAKNQRNVETI